MKYKIKTVCITSNVFFNHFNHSNGTHSAFPACLRNPYIQEGVNCVPLIQATMFLGIPKWLSNASFRFKITSTLYFLPFLYGATLCLQYLSIQWPSCMWSPQTTHRQGTPKSWVPRLTIIARGNTDPWVNTGPRWPSSSSWLWKSDFQSLYSLNIHTMRW